MSAPEPVLSFNLQHVFAGERLQAFSDAVFAIIATFMVVPLKLTTEIVKKYPGGFQDFDLASYLTYQWPRYLVYGYSFSLVVDAWYNHHSIFSMVEQVDDVILWLNLLCLLLVSFLPYATGLVSSYPAVKENIENEHLAITIASLNIALIGVCMVIILLYALRKQALVHPEVAENSNIRTVKRAAIFSLCIKPAIALVAMGLSFVASVPGLSLFFFYTIGIFAVLIKSGLYIYFNYKGIIAKLPGSLFKVSKFRIEAFSDGVFSIVATLIVLDITTENIPKPDDVEEKGGDLSEALKEQSHVLLAYVTSFIIVGLLWFVHYSMMHFIKKMTITLTFLNSWTLFMVGGIPFVAGVNTIFSDDSQEGNSVTGPNKRDSIRALSAVVFLIGVCQALFWTVALFQKKHVLSDNVNHHNSEPLQFSKTLVFPLVSLVIFWGTFSQTFIDYHIYNYLLFSTMFIFLILKAVFRWHSMCVMAVKRKLLNINSNDQDTREADIAKGSLLGHHHGNTGEVNRSTSNSPLHDHVSDDVELDHHNFIELVDGKNVANT